MTKPVPPLAILLLCDDPALAAQVGDVLRASGHVVDRVRADDLGGAASTASLHALAIVDLSPAGCEPRRLLAQLHRIEPACPVVAIGNRFMLHERLVAGELAVEGYLARPFSRRELLAAVAGVLGRPRS